MKRAIFTLFMLLVLVALAALVSGCKDADRVCIASIIERPDRYMGRPVIVVGEVTKVYSVDLIIAQASAYQVDDGSGRIWVMTKTGSPKEGVKVGVKGRVSSGVKLGKESLGAVIREEERRTRE